MHDDVRAVRREHVDAPVVGEEVRGDRRRGAGQRHQLDDRVGSADVQVDDRDLAVAAGIVGVDRHVADVVDRVDRDQALARQRLDRCRRRPAADDVRLDRVDDRAVVVELHCLALGRGGELGEGGDDVGGSGADRQVHRGAVAGVLHGQHGAGGVDGLAVEDLVADVREERAQHLVAIAAAAGEVVGDELRIRAEHGAELVLVGMRRRFGLVEERIQRVDGVGDVVDRLDQVVGRRQRRREVGRGRIRIELELRLHDLVDEAAHRRDEDLRGRGADQGAQRHRVGLRGVGRLVEIGAAVDANTRRAGDGIRERESVCGGGDGLDRGAGVGAVRIDVEEARRGADDRPEVRIAGDAGAAGAAARGGVTDAGAL